MPAERMPPLETSLLARLLVLLARCAVRFPKTILVLALAAAGASLFLSTTRLGYHTDRSALVSRQSKYNERWLAYVQEFGAKEDVVVVVEGRDLASITPALDDLSLEISRQNQWFYAVLHAIDLSKLRAKGLYQLPAAQLRAIDGFVVQEVGPIVRGGWSYLAPGAMAVGTVAHLQAVPPQQLPQAIEAAQVKLMQLVESLTASLRDRTSYRSPWPAMSADGMQGIDLTSQRLVSANGRMGFILLKLADRPSDRSFVQNSEGLDALRGLVAEAKTRHPNVEIGLTGLPVMENDEMRSSQSSMTLATFLSLAGVVLVLVAGFGGVRHSLLAMGAMMTGMACSLGLTTLTLGHLNILSSAFGAILVGLGINYGTYYVARYLRLRQAGYGVDQSLVGTAGSVGSGITIGAATTAIAFYMSGFTAFTGVAELGLVAGGGIVLCWLAATTLLPAIVRLSDAKHPERPLPVPLNFHTWIDPILARPRRVLVFSIAVTAALAWGLPRLDYDYNLLHLQPAGLESVALEHRLLSETGQSAWFALSIADSPEAAAARKERFSKLASVERVEEIASHFPADNAFKRPLIEGIRAKVSGLPESPPFIPVAPPEQFGAMLATAKSFMDGTPRAAAFQQRLDQLGVVLRAMPAAEYGARLSAYQQRVAGELLARLRALRDASCPEPPQVADLPEGLVARFVGRHGRHLVKVYAKNDIWNMQALSQFVSEVRSVDPEVTGNPLQVYEASQQMKQSFEQAGWLALAAILPFVFCTLGGVRATLLAMLPLALGMIQTFGLMGLLGIPRNPANMIALPLMLGMGMDNGVYVAHDFLKQRGRYRMSPATGMAVILNTLTTMVGFAVLILADHRGLQSLGRVLTIGMACYLFSSFVILPAFLSWLTLGRSRRAESEPLPERPLSEAELSEAIRRFDGPYDGTEVPADARPARRSEAASF